MGHSCCCVVTCKNNGRNSKCKFYTFPKQSWKLDQREKWIAAVKRKNVDGSPWYPRLHDTICSAHFIGGKKSEDPGSPSYIPTIFPPIYRKKKVDESKVLARYQRFVNRSKNNIAVTSQTPNTQSIEESKENIRIVKDLYNSCKRERNIEENGLEDTKPVTSEEKCLESQENKMNELEHGVNDIKEENIAECRACLQKIYAENNFYNLFDCWDQQEGMETTIAEDLSRIANIQVSESDFYPKVICENCCALLQSACTFASIVRKSDYFLRQRFKEIPLQDEISNEVWPKPIQLDQNVNNSIYDTDKEIKKEVLSEDECNGYGVTEDQDYANLDIKVEPEEITSKEPSQSIERVINGTNNLECSNDKSPSLTNGSVDRSEEQKEATVKEEPVSEDDLEKTGADLPLECMLCAKILQSITGLKAHVIAQHSYKSVKRKLSNSVSPEKKNHSQKYTCSICRRIFATSTDLMVHETCHNKSVCYGCNESFDSFILLTEHRNKCKPLSSKETTRLKTLNDVKRPQSRESQSEYTCSTCNKTCNTAGHLTEHQRKHHPHKRTSTDYSDESWSTDSM